MRWSHSFTILLAILIFTCPLGMELSPPGMGLDLKNAVAADDPPRGDKETFDRTLWCSHKLTACLKAGNKFCEAAGTTAGPSYGQCLYDAKLKCRSSWGERSDCETRERIIREIPFQNFLKPADTLELPTAPTKPSTVQPPTRGRFRFNRSRFKGVMSRGIDQLPPAVNPDPEPPALPNTEHQGGTP
jgi:hypothetical protein